MTSNNKAEEIINKVLNSMFFKGTLGRASKISRNAESLLKLLKSALQKSNELGKGGIFDQIRDKVYVLGKLVKAYAKGDYREIKTQNLILIVAGLIYLVSPLDFVPDVLPFVGFTDDVALLVYIVNAISDEITKFEDWEKTGLIKDEIQA